MRLPAPLVLCLSLAVAPCLSRAEPASGTPAPLVAWRQQANRVTITRDDWGVPHVRGKTDADAVFGVIYAQAEDDFNRIETNYLVSLGRLAEAEGESALWQDLRMRLYITPADLRAKYAASPAWLRKLMTAWADGLNYYLATHPATRPHVIMHFEPWMALSFSEGSIGGDIERISLKSLQDFYGAPGGPPAPSARATVGDVRPATASQLAQLSTEEPSGSNGFAVAPARSAHGHALLLINPHTSFFFREEAQMTSDEGLNAYGAMTWGQFFVYQGFNARAGWMHTSSGADNQDEYAEAVLHTDAGLVYRYGERVRPVHGEVVELHYKTAVGMSTKKFTVYRTHHGPIVRAENGRWISVRMMAEPVKALTQSYLRTKARDYAAFRKTMELHTNSSNNTVFADAEGNIAYFHANFVPRRDPAFDWTRPVDGSTPRTEWKGVLGVEQSPLVHNPASGWIQNTNNWPWAAAGPSSPKRADYPRYVETYLENPRGLHAVRVLEARRDFTLETLRDAAYDPVLTAFEGLIPSLLSAYDETPDSSALKAALGEQIALLRAWDRRSSADSVETTLAVYWGEQLWKRVKAEDLDGEDLNVYEFLEKRTLPLHRLQDLATASSQLVADFGSWKTPWGRVNRFQRLTGDIVQPFSDAAESTAVPFTSSRWGSLAAFGAKAYPGTKRWYGTSGNSFVAVVEFGPRVRAKAVTAGGLHSVPGSPHFNDQSARYAAGDLRDVYFYPDQLKGHIERVYRPGQ